MLGDVWIVCIYVWMIFVGVRVVCEVYVWGIFLGIFDCGVSYKFIMSFFVLLLGISKIMVILGFEVVILDVNKW